MSQGRLSFRTPEVAALFAQVQSICHPEYPFLDPNYSPGGYYPVTDFTLDVANWLRDDNHAAISEFWSYLTWNGVAEKLLLKKCLAVKIPAIFGLDDATAIEAQAIYLLSSRQSLNDPNGNSVALVASSLLATRLASIGWVPPRATLEALRQGAAIKANVEGGPGVRARRIEAADSAILELLQVRPEEIKLAGEWLIKIPPMSRLVVADYFSRNWAQGSLRSSLYYGDRCYGCHGAWNLHFINWVGCFQTPQGSQTVPHGITKANLQGALMRIGIEAKKSSKKEELLAIGRQHDGFIASVIQEFAPEVKTPKPEWEVALKGWQARCSNLQPVAATLLNSLGMQSLFEG